MPRLVYVAPAEWYFLSHRLELARAARTKGYEVWVVAGEERGLGDALRAEGFGFIDLPIARGSTSPMSELRTIRFLVSTYRRIKPDLVHHVAMKAALYGSLAARLTGVPAVVNAVAGKGYVGGAQGFKGRGLQLVSGLIQRIAMGRPGWKTIFQNPENVEDFVSRGVVRRGDAVLIRGAGVDLQVFRSREEPRGPVTVLFASRLLWSKGIGTLVDAWRALRDSGVAGRLVIVGQPDVRNPDSVSEGQLRAWEAEGVAEWWGRRDDMPEVLGSCHVVCLPTVYGEGIPKILLEAAAAGRPIVATDMPGCREIVRHGINGLLVPPHDPRSLADALRRTVEDAELRSTMGRAGRRLAEGEFDVEHVVQQTLRVYEELLA